MNEMLFKSIEQRQGPQTIHETTFDFLERGGSREAVEIRQWIESWFQAIPDNRKKSVEKRLKARDFEQFLAAMFELEVHEIFRRFGCVIEMEPKLPGSNGTVDFHVVDKNQNFYIEATVCGIEQGQLEPHKNEADAIVKLRRHLKKPLHSDLCLWKMGGELKKSLGREFIRQFQNLLDRHTSEEVRNIHGEHVSPELPSLLSTEFREGDWILKGWLRPAVAPSGIGRVQSPLKAGHIDGETPITTALGKKVKNWKDRKITDQVFLIAINVCHSDSLSEDPPKAIFGLERPDDEEENFRKYLSCVDGVIVFKNARLRNVRNAPVRLYKNGNRTIPECLHFLLQERRLGDLLGISTH